MQGIIHLATVLLLEAILLATIGHSWGGAWMQRMYGTIQPDIFEVFGGHAEVSMQAWKQGWLALQPIEILASSRNAPT